MDKLVDIGGEGGLSDFRGALGSNTGDDFHELWATRQAIRLLLKEGGLTVITVEGLSPSDEAGAPVDTWDGVDCTQYFDGDSVANAKRVRLEQLKYSAANPTGAWSTARLVEGPRRERSVIGRLARAWKALNDRGGPGVQLEVALVSNQRADAELVAAMGRAAGGHVTPPKTKPAATAADELRLAHATGLNREDFQAFAAAFSLDTGTGSRFAIEEKVLRAVAAWTDHDVQRIVVGLRQFVRNRMRPEFAGEQITREAILLHLGAADFDTLFPCPPKLASIAEPISRQPIRDAARLVLDGAQRVCLHGGGGVGKTTALQEIAAALPANSLMVTYDCYGEGRYLDPSAYRHRSTDAFLQLTNELASRLALPLLLSRHQGSDFPRLFANRLAHAAKALAAQDPKALIVIAIDAADNAITAAASRTPIETPFVRDFILIGDLPANVRFVVTARTGRLPQLHLPADYRKVEIEPFLLAETAAHVRQVWAGARDSWIEDFHHLSRGVPRVQAYALQDGGEAPAERINRLRPTGKSLDDVFRHLFNEALAKTGSLAEISRLCAGLIALARPIPLEDLAAVVGSSQAHLRDICADLAPGIRIDHDRVSFADEDFEHFVRDEGAADLPDVTQKAADWLIGRAENNAYAALNVAPALAAAGRGSALLDLVEREPAPKAITDPVQRREAEIQRLQLAIKVCRDARDLGKAVRFVLIGAEGVKTEAALLELLADNPDLAVRFAADTVGRLIFSNANLLAQQGPMLFHKLSADAEQGDAISVREGQRLLRAWLNERGHRKRDDDYGDRQVWPISANDVASEVDAVLRLRGADRAIRYIRSWRPRTLHHEVAFLLAPRLIAEGRAAEVEAVAASQLLTPARALFLLAPLAIAGSAVDTDQMSAGLEMVGRAHLDLKDYFNRFHESTSTTVRGYDAILAACEILTSRGLAAETVDRVLGKFLQPDLRRIDSLHTHDADKLDLLLRAFCLSEARAGRTPDSKDFFTRRPEPADEAARRRQRRDSETRDRELEEFCGAVFGIYRATAQSLVGAVPASEVPAMLASAAARLEQEQWRLSRQHGSGALRAHAASCAMTVTVAGCPAREVMPIVAAIHGRWTQGGDAPNAKFVALLSLRHELHDALLRDLATAAQNTRAMRIGAEEKSKVLISLARLIRPISNDDANAVFNEAVEAASELDTEIVAQLQLIDRLVARGGALVADKGQTSRELSDVIADAGVRLEHHDGFPWGAAMRAVARLNLPLALANAARWDDEDIARLGSTLGPTIKAGLSERTLRPAQALALALLQGCEEGAVAALLDIEQNHRPMLAQFVEEAARDVLARDAAHNATVDEIIRRAGSAGPYARRLLDQNAFQRDLPSPPQRAERYSPPGGEPQKAIDPLDGHVWLRDALIEPFALGAAVEALVEAGRTTKCYVSTGRALTSARDAVAPRDRLAHIAALAEATHDDLRDEGGKALLDALSHWSQAPAILAWRRSDLAGVIVRRFPEFARYHQYDQSQLSRAIALTGMADADVPDLILRGLESHVDGLGADLIFSLLGTISERLPADAVAVLIAWYVARLSHRIPVQDRNLTVDDAQLPASPDEAVARMIFAYLGDFDVRLRWRAGHALRRLARLGDDGSLSAVVGQYERCADAAFRAPSLPFYWLGARLWYVIAWERVATETPARGAVAGPALLRIALDETFPHVLVREFARDACLELAASGVLDLTQDDRDRLALVNQSALPPADEVDGVTRYFDHRDEGRRFRFDTMDSLPYWYRPILSVFAAVDTEKLLTTAEHFIIDRWGYDGNLRAYNDEPRLARMRDRDWTLASNRHGARPTLERLNNHVEWHAALCALGELLKTEPLERHEDDDDYDTLQATLRRNTLTTPPFWLSDLRTPTPLIARYWSEPTGAVAAWVDDVHEARHRQELFPQDVADYVVVHADIEVRSSDRYDQVTVASALVQPETGAALVRALQTFDRAWDYRLPAEGEGAEIDIASYRLMGWLNENNGDPALDSSDPFRGNAKVLASSPGARVTADCGLRQVGAGPVTWCAPGAAKPMFIYEVWGEAEKDDESYASVSVASGRRLLAHRSQLREFLQRQSLDLLVEVEVQRRAREGRRHSGEEDAPLPEAQFDRLYKLGTDGGLSIAEGRLGAWAPDC